MKTNVISNTAIIVFGIFLIIVLKFISFNVVEVEKQEKKNSIPIIENYIKKEIVFEDYPWQSSYEYYKYYYNESVDELFLANTLYNRINNIEVIKKEINTYLSVIPKEIVLAINIDVLIKTDSLINITKDKPTDKGIKVRIYLYDLNEHILHYINIVD